MEDDGLTEKQFMTLLAAERAAQEEQGSIDELADRVARAMTEAAFAVFPALKEMSAEQIREFGNDVSRLSTDFAFRAAHLADEAEQSNAAGGGENS